MLRALNLEPDANPEQVLARVSQDIEQFVDGAEQFDDITMLCFRYSGAGASLNAAANIQGDLHE